MASTQPNFNQSKNNNNTTINTNNNNKMANSTIEVKKDVKPQKPIPLKKKVLTDE